MKKTLCIFLALSTMFLSVYATNSIPEADRLSCWNATVDSTDSSGNQRIYRMTVQPKIAFGGVMSMGTFSASNIEAYTTYAAQEWTTVGMPVNEVNIGSANIIVYAGKRQAMLLIDNTITATTYLLPGHTYFHNGTGQPEKNWYYNSDVKCGYISNFNKVVLIWDDIIGNKLDISEGTYKNVLLHEVGHALGWYGHSSNTTDIMHKAAKDSFLLTSRDVNHVKQIKGY
ncbi:MAG: matrixin family metalloprotease [Clostridia bacterium]|nr:matrixin family metalloprotease [Clostridia bacterium]